MRTTVLSLLVALLAASPAIAAAAPSEQEVHAIAAAQAEYERARRAIERLDWKAAIGALEAAARLDPGNPEYQNLLGFSHRSAGDLDAAFRHYARALELNPRHRATHEYLGRAYLMADQPEKAMEHLRLLERYCPDGCRERELLRQAIAEYPWPPPGRAASRPY